MNKNNNPMDTIRANIWLGRTTLFSAPCIPPVVYDSQAKSFLYIHRTENNAYMHIMHANKTA